MRLLNATLLAAMDTGNYDLYFLATIQDNFNGNVYLSAAPTGYELSDLELVLTVQMPAFMDVPFYRTSIVLTRGVTIAGLHYTLSTSKFTIINSTWDGNFQTFKCHLIPRVHYSAAGDLTYKQVIDAFCLTYGKTAVYLDPAAAWLSYQFLPTGKMVILNNAQTLFQQLKQKYFIFACDNGSDQILFYTAFTHAASPQYQITGYRFVVDYNVDQRRQYIWRDENETLHKTAPSFALASQPDAAVQSIMSLLDLGTGVVLAGSYKNVANAGKIYRSLDYGLTWDAGYTTVYSGIYSLLNLGGGILLAAGYYGGPILRSVDYGVTWTEVQHIGNDTTLCLTDCGNGIVLVGHINPSGTPGCQIYKSVDYGLTWSLAQSLGAESQVYSILYVGSGICLAGTALNGRVYRSTDYGSTWSLVQQLGAETQVFSLLGLGSGIVLAGTGPNGKIYKSTNSGQTWALVYSSGEQYIYTLNTLGGGVVIAGTGPNGKVYRSVDFGVTWALVQALGTENSVRSFITLGNGSTLAGTGEHAQIHKSLNCAADLDIIHDLGFMPSTAAEPSAYFLLAQPKFDPFPVHLKYQSSDFIRVNLLQGGTYDFTCAQVVEIFKMQETQKIMPYRMIICQTEWLSNTAAGPLPGTIERVGSYTPLVTASFDDVLSTNDNNVQAAMDTLDNHTHGPQIAGSLEKDVLDDADQFPLVDSSTLTHVVKYSLWSNIKTRVLDYLGIYLDAATRITSPDDTDLVTLVDETTVGKLIKGMTWADLRSVLLKDGWIPVIDTWTYASASTITVPSGAMSIYSVGDKIKWTQTTVKYGVIVAVTDTLLTIAVNIDYVLTNAVISVIFYSHDASPARFPAWFNVAPPTYNTGYIDDGAGGQPVTQFARYSIQGRLLTFHTHITPYKAGTSIYLSVFADTALPLINRAKYSGRDAAGYWSMHDNSMANDYFNAMIHYSDNNFYPSNPIPISDNDYLIDLSMLIIYEI